MQFSLGKVYWGAMHLSFTQPVPYLDSHRPKVLSNHNTRWWLLNLNYNFMIKSKNPSQQHTHLLRRHDKTLSLPRHRGPPATMRKLLLQPYGSMIFPIIWCKMDECSSPIMSPGTFMAPRTIPLPRFQLFGIFHA